MSVPDIVQRALVEPRAFQGACFDMCLSFKRGDEQRALAARAAMWSSGRLVGPVLLEGGEPHAAREVDLAEVPLSTTVHGAARLPNGAVVACMSFGYGPPEDGDSGPYVDLTLYEGALRPAYPLGPLWPFDNGQDHAWVLELSEWFRGIAEAMHAVAPIIGGSIGCEVGGDEVVRRVQDVPSERWVGYLVPDGGALAWFPPNVLRAPFGFDPPAATEDPRP